MKRIRIEYDVYIDERIAEHHTVYGCSIDYAYKNGMRDYTPTPRLPLRDRVRLRLVRWLAFGRWA